MKRNRIITYKHKEGLSFNLDILIERELTNDLRTRFIKDDNCHPLNIQELQCISECLSSVDNNFLTSHVSNKEIQDTVDQLALNKSSRPDGFPVEVFQKYRHIMGNAVCRAVKAFFHSGKILKEINHTFIALIPKVDNPLTANDFKPISLCNTIYKIIAKILPNRLINVIPKLIHSLQGAFIPERDIQDNILIAHEIFHSFRTKQGMDGN